jgi:MerR family copper efflux transcriptional regulator
MTRKMGKPRHLLMFDAAKADGDLLPRPQGDAATSEKAGDEAKLLQVGDLAKACGKTVRAIHHYESVGLLTPHARSKGRYRLYATDAVSRVRWINKLSNSGMTLSEIQQILELWEQSPSAPEGMAKIRGVYHQKLEEVHEQIAQLTALERELLASLRYLDTCETCDPGELIAACGACRARECGQPEPDLVAGLYAGQSSNPTEEPS